LLNPEADLNRYIFLAILFALAGGVLVAHAQSQGQPDPAFMTKAIQTLQQQRNNAQDQLAAEQARRMMLEDEVTKLKADAEAAKKEPAK
jgi:hypothetical protein